MDKFYKSVQLGGHKTWIRIPDRVTLKIILFHSIGVFLVICLGFGFLEVAR